MAVNFAPYQSSPPESTRALSPPPLRSPTASPKPQQQQQKAHAAISSVANNSDPWAAARAQNLADPAQYSDDEPYTDLEGGRDDDHVMRGRSGGGGFRFSANSSGFETSLGLSLALEASLAYLVLPPAGGAVLLLFEHKSDYVRFHAWQSALLFGTLFMVHIIFSWTAVISWMLFAVDMLLIVYLVAGAWRNAETLDRVEIPFFGRLASSFVDDE